MNESVKEFDFFSKGKKDFYTKEVSYKSFLVQGKHRERPPFVTIILTTYNRPVLLRQALESALNQKKFDDYQIIVADNEGKPIEEETLTAEVVKSYQDEKIIYYRHSQELLFKENAAARLARSPWIVFLHDDDMLAEDHLAVMTSIIRKYKEIKFLGCPVKEFRVGWNVKVNQSSNTFNIGIQKYLKDTICLRDWTGWLGALISRKHYIAMGGIPNIAMGCGDLVMVYVFHHHYGTYKCSSKPLYFYRRGKQQESFTKKEVWERTFINEYFFYKYVIRRYHRITYKIWERYIAYSILEDCKIYNKGLYHPHIDINHVIFQCGMPKDVVEKGLRYHITKAVFDLYRKSVSWLDHMNVDVLKRTDIHIVI